MKTRFLQPVALLLSLTVAFSACKKDDAAPAISNDEAANAVGEMLASDFSGSTSDAATVSTADANQAGGRISINGRSQATSCGVEKDSTVSRASASGALITYSRMATFSYTLTCNGIVPSTLALNFTGSSTRTGIKVSATGSSTGAFTMTGFEVASSNYTVNGTFNRTESITELVGTKTYTGTHTLTVTDVLVDKTSREIKGGSASYTMTGLTGTGTTYTHTGSITFMGSGTATITVNGASYSVNLVSGAVTPS